MKNKSLVKNFAKVIFAVTILALLSSCNRGVGCPTNLSVDVLSIMHSAVQIIF